ncbi:MAG: helix-turn-helix transcriptional regulator [Pseudomonadota bacterium]
MHTTRTDAQVLKGLLDALVLTVLKRGENYGFGILEDVQKLLDGNDSLLRDATLYPLLHRLESRGFVASHYQPGDRGTARKYYRITPSGKKMLQDRIAEWRHVTSILQKVVLPREDL